MRHFPGFFVTIFCLGWGVSSLVADDKSPAESLPANEEYKKAPDQPIDLDNQKTLYVVAYAHLDTQWRWTYPQVLREFIPNTMRKNFKLFEKFPNYVFNFSGSRRYEFMKEYYPEDYAKVKDYVAQGRWFPCGSSVDETDAVVPGLESYVRNTLYGNRFFRREFNVASQEFMLPDCFGFPACLPSIIAHCGMKGFSTQKLTWGVATPNHEIPFKVGVWEGISGDSVTAAFDPGAYDGGVREDLSNSNGWNMRIENTGKLSKVLVDYHYYGTGDRGGAPDDTSVKWIEHSINSQGPLRVVESTAEKMFLDITPEQKARLPKYKGELMLTNHSAGAMTSEAYMKRWNRKNELLANAAESAASTAYLLGSLPYPNERLYSAWDLILGSQMHDMIPGTSLPLAYNYCWNDENVAANQLCSVAESSSAAVISLMDTRVAGKSIPIVVYNPLSIDREDVVETTLPFNGDPSQGLTVYDPAGQPVPTQIKEQKNGQATLLFLAKVPSIGYAAFEARPGKPPEGTGNLKITENSLENSRYQVSINTDGDISSILDKTTQKELLHSPIKLVFQYEKPKVCPAWNMDWEDRVKPPTGTVAGPVTARIVENGPARVSLQIERSSMGSKFSQQIRLSDGGAANRVEVVSDIDWHTQESSLRATFPLAVTNPLATFDAQLGTIQRGNSEAIKFEYAQHQWMDLTDSDGSYGVSILNDCKYAADKPDNQTLRLTMLYTPAVRNDYQDQATQDLGRHHIVYGISGHAGDWTKGSTVWEAARLNQPLISFVTTPHEGALGKSFSLFKSNQDQLQITAVKKAEDSDELIIRVRELSGQPVSGVQITSGLPMAAAREVDGQEMDRGTASVNNGALSLDLTPYQLRAFAIKFSPLQQPAPPVTSTTVDLPYDLNVVTSLSNLKSGAFDDSGHSYTAELFPVKLIREGVEFKLGPTDGGNNALASNGQAIELPSGNYNHVYVLAAALGDQSDNFQIDGKPRPCVVQDWSEFIGQWDNRKWIGTIPELDYGWKPTFNGLTPGYIKPSRLAWYGSHRHDASKGNEFYQYTYLFQYAFDLPPGAKTLTLPTNPKIRIFAVSVARDSVDVTPGAPLFDTLADHAANVQ